MNKKKLYFAPDTEIVDVLTEGVLTAASIVGDEGSGIIPGTEADE